MRRTAFSPALSLLVGLLVASSAPGLAVAHGSAHRQTSQHEREHQADFAGEDHEDGVAAERAHALAPDHLPTRAQVGAAIGATDHEDHAHPQLSAAISTRPEAQLFVVTTRPPIAAPTESITSATSFDEIRAVPRGPPLHALRQPRAPPLG